MQADSIQHLELILLFLLLLVAGLAVLARRFHTPYPIVLVIGGLLLSFIPNLPHISLNPDIVFLVFLPPLLYAAAYNTSWRDFRHNLISIFLLAFGLVGFTVIGVALGSGWALPEFNFRMGAVLGACVATTDAIALGAIARRVGLPRQISDVLEGESLVNDASGLLALEFTIALVVTGRTPTIPAAMEELVWLVVGGILAGLLVGFIIQKILLQITGVSIQITVSLGIPYIAYLFGQDIHGSGVLAAVACGLYMGQKHSQTYGPLSRLENSAVWETFDFILNGVVFVLIGLQLPFILQGISGLSLGRLLTYGAIFSAFVIVLRLVWSYFASWLSWFLRRKLLRRRERPPGMRYVFMVGWTGMRGVIALAAAIAVPRYLANGAPFPERNVIIFLTFCVIFTTLVLQGLTLPTVIRKLGFSGGKGGRIEEWTARRIILLDVLDQLKERRSQADPEQAPLYDDFIRRYNGRLALIEAGEDKKEQQKKDLVFANEYRSLARELRALERSSALRLRRENKINDTVLRRIERELDLIDVRYQLS
jgi:CPA1 family monovalent cation:H+ antiporter